MLAAQVCSAQDIHFSQIDTDPLLFNPAYTGFFDGSGRFGVIYRNQWASVSQPYSTIAATAELPLVRNRYHRNGLSLGAFFFSDHEGTLQYGTTDFTASLAYYQAIGKGSQTLLSIAAEGGYAQLGFNPSGAILENPSEQFSNTSVGVLTIGAGIACYHSFSDELYCRGGLSVRNINSPNISYQGLDDAYLLPKACLHARAEWMHWSRMSLMPIVAYQWQTGYQELLYGCDVKWYLESDNLSFSAGLACRHADAIILNLSAEFNSLLFAFSYDANISHLAAASRTIGAAEVALVYRLSRNTDKTQKSLPCPIF